MNLPLLLQATFKIEIDWLTDNLLNGGDYDITILSANLQWCVRLPAPDAEVTITEKTVSVKKEKVTMVGDMETRVVESSPTFSETLMPITEVTEGELVRFVLRCDTIR